MTSEFEKIAFDDNLRMFANKVGIICSLENGDKISELDAYKQIKTLWKTLKKSKKGLRVGEEEIDNESS